MCLGACTDTTTIHSEQRLGEAKLLVTTADVRVVIEHQRVGVDGKTQSVLCAEPSPDVATAINKAFDANTKAEGRVTPPAIGTPLEGSLAFALSRLSVEQVAQLTQRLPTIQALRDGLYRACEAYGNGAIGPSAYALILSRYGDLLVTLLYGELAAGDFDRPLATLNGFAAGAASAGESKGEGGKAEFPTTGAPTGNTPLAETAVEKAATAYLNARAALAAPHIPAADREKLRKNMAEKRKALVDALKMPDGDTGGAADTSGRELAPVAALAEAARSSANALERMHDRYYGRDPRGPIIAACISAFEQRGVRQAGISNAAVQSAAGPGERDLDAVFIDLCSQVIMSVSNIKEH
jgi:hypothetical protein